MKLTRKKKWAIAVGVSLAALLLSGELFCRFWLGLGDPPLTTFEPDIEYRFTPGHYRRFGNDISYNSYSMRSPEISQKKTDPQELRVLMIGDSILNGGALTDDRDVISAILQRRMEKALSRPVAIMNVSAGSWGPPNQLTWLKRYGLFEADVVILVLSSGDAADAPGPVSPKGDPAFPETTPVLALQEAVVRYALPRLKSAPPPAPPAPQEEIEANTRICREALSEIARRVTDSGADMFIVRWCDREEMSGVQKPGLQVIRETIAPFQLHLLDLQLPQQSLMKSTDIFRDEIHPNPAGAELIADTVEPELLQRLKNRPATTQPASAP